MPNLRMLEPQVLGMLDPDTGMSTNAVRSVLATAIACAHARHVTDEWMCDFINLTSEAHVLISDLECGLRVRQVLEKLEPARNPEILDETIDNLIKRLDKLRSVIRDKFILVLQCPTPTDKVS